MMHRFKYCEEYIIGDQIVAHFRESDCELCIKEYYGDGKNLEPSEKRLLEEKMKMFEFKKDFKEVVNGK